MNEDSASDDIQFDDDDYEQQHDEVKKKATGKKKVMNRVGGISNRSSKASTPVPMRHPDLVTNMLSLPASELSFKNKHVKLTKKPRNWKSNLITEKERQAAVQVPTCSIAFSFCCILAP